MLWNKVADGFVLSDVFLLVLAGYAAYSILFPRQEQSGDRRLMWFLLFYTIILAAIFSLLPYKTPWNMLVFYQGMLLLAGYGGAQLLERYKSGVLRWAATAFLVLGGAHLVWQAYQLNHVHHSDQASPHIYAHPLPDVTAVADSMLAIADAQPEGRTLHAEVIFPKSDYWPFPWYLRSLERVGWWNAVDEKSVAAPLILAATSLEKELTHKLYELPPPGQRYLYIPVFQTAPQLRPGIPMQLYARSDIWQAWKRGDEED